MNVRRLTPVARFLRDNLTPAAWQPVADPRKARGQRYSWVGLLNLLMLGLCTARVALRDVERLGRQMSVRRYFGLTGTPSDSSLDRVIRLLKPGAVQEVLRAQVLRFHRSKRMEVDPSIGVSIVAIDGKGIGADRVQKHPQSTSMRPRPRRRGAKSDLSTRSKSSKKEDKKKWTTPDISAGPDGTIYLVKVLRAVHVASAVKPALDQFIIPAGRGEAPMLTAFIWNLLRAYGRTIVECVSLDAGFATQNVLYWLVMWRVHFILAIKGNAGNLCGQLRHRMGGEGEEPPPGGWQLETEEKRNGSVLRRRFARLIERGDLWSGHHQQVWRIRQTTERAGRPTAVDDRIYITSLPEGRISIPQCVAAIRAHWGVENDCNWTLDVPWLEDSHAWVRIGEAREILGLLRLIAYNFVRVLRHRVLRGPKKGHIPYRDILERIRDALVMPGVLATSGDT